MLTAQIRTRLLRVMRRKFKVEIAEIRSNDWHPEDIANYLKSRGWLVLHDKDCADTFLAGWHRPILQSVCGDFLIKNAQFTTARRSHRHFIPTTVIVKKAWGDAPDTVFSYPWVIQPVVDVTRKASREAYRALKYARDLPCKVDLHDANTGMFMDTPVLFDW